MHAAATTEFSTLSLHDALPIFRLLRCRQAGSGRSRHPSSQRSAQRVRTSPLPAPPRPRLRRSRSEEHTSELQSQSNLVCRLLLEKKKRRDPEAPQGTEVGGPPE